MMEPLPKVEMNIFETILARRSIRRYQPRVVDAAIIRILLEAAVRAPTAVHQEPWAFVIIQDKPWLKRLSNLAKPLFLAEVKQLAPQHLPPHLIDAVDRQDFNIFHDANTLILICGNTAAPFYLADCWLAAENMMLAACAMGLGSCVIGSAVTALNALEMKKNLNVPDQYAIVAPIILGYSSEDVKPELRKRPVVFANIPICKKH